MTWLKDLITNPFFIVAVSSWFIAQVLKTIIYAIANKKVDLSRIVGDGGIPSGHSATVSSLAFMCLLVYGTHSFEFAIAVILAIIVCHDAMGVRSEAGKHAVILNKLIHSHESLSDENHSKESLNEFVGHTPVQVMAGIAVGIANAIFMYIIFFRM